MDEKARAKLTRSISRQGKSFPLGATLCCGDANSSVLAKRGSAAELLSFYRVDGPEPSRAIDLDLSTDHAFDH